MHAAKYGMRNFIDLITQAQANTLNEGISGYSMAHAEVPRRDGGPSSPNGFLRINSVMNQIAGSSLNSEDGATVLLQRLNYLCDAISEFGHRRGGNMARKMDDAVTHLRSFFPRDGDIEGALRDPETMQNIRDGLNFLRTQLRSDGVMVESVEEDWYARRDELEPDMVFKDREGYLVKLDHRVPGDGTKWYVATWYGRSWAYDDSTIEPGELVQQCDDPAA